MAEQTDADIYILGEWKYARLTSGSKSGLDKLKVRFLINNKTCKSPTVVMSECLR